MKYLTCLLLIIFHFCSGFSQTIIEGQILDKDTRKPLMYCNVGILHSTKGTITNADGIYSLDLQNLNDTLAISYIGYQPFRIAISNLPADGKIYLASASVNLQTTVISANTFLYDLVANCKKVNRPSKYTAKTYFELDSYMEGQPVEMIECYYNGNYFGPNIESLGFKSGKVYLAEYDKMFFTNLETSKAVSSLRLFMHNDYFPSQPFEMSKASLKKLYSLKLIEKYNENGTVYLVGFTPLQKNNRYFQGKAWIDSASNHVLKVNFNVTDAAIHPFIPLWTTDSILSIDLDITESFKKIDGKIYVDVVDFKYNMRYQNREKMVNNISTTGILHVYDLKEKFTLPFFDYDPNLSDYRKIFMSPYNDFFWKNRDSIVISEKRNSNRQYFESRGEELKHNIGGFYYNTFFKDNIIRWGRNIRINVKEISDSMHIHKANQPMMPNSLYKFKAQIFLDINENSNEIHTLTNTFLDGFNSYYYLPLDSSTDCFANIYFDILESERIELEKDLTKPGLTQENIKLIYKNRVARIEQLTQKYFAEVERGQNKQALTKWNQYIIERLGIDNMAIYQIKP